MNCLANKWLERTSLRRHGPCGVWQAPRRLRSPLSHTVGRPWMGLLLRLATWGGKLEWQDDRSVWTGLRTM